MKNYISYLIIPFVYACAIIWHVAFWSTFDINIFSFFSIQEIITSFIYPFSNKVGITLGFVIIFAIVVQIRFNHKICEIQKSETYTSPKKKKNLKREKFFKYMSKAYRFTSFIAGLYLVFLLHSSYGYILGSILILPFLTNLSDEINLSKILFPFISKPSILLNFFIVAIPLYCFGYSKNEAYLIKDNINYNEIHFENENCCNNSAPLKYIGGTNKYIFLTDTLNSNIYQIDRSKTPIIIFKRKIKDQQIRIKF